MPARPNKEYWAERENILMERLLEKGEECNERLVKDYQKVAANIQTEIEAFYTRFSDHNQISYAEARRILTGDERKRYRMSLEEYIEKGRTLNIHQEYADELENASTVYRVNRLQALQTQIRAEIDLLTARYDNGVKKTAADIYQEGYYRNIYEVQKGMGMGLDFAVLDTKTVQNVLATPWTADDKTFSARIWDDRTGLVNRLDTLMAQSLIRGDDPRKMYQHIEQFLNPKYMGKGKNGVNSCARRLILTESAFFASKAIYDAYKSQGVEMFQFLATLDEKTCTICGDLESSEANQEGFPLAAYTVGVNANPMHPHCRCTTIPFFPPDDLDIDHERAARDDKGKYYTVPADMTYNAWKEKYGSGKRGKDKKSDGDGLTQAVIEGIMEADGGDMVDDHFAARSAHKNTGTRVKYNPDADFGIQIDGYPENVISGLSKASAEVAREGAKSGVEHLRLVDLKTGEIIPFKSGGESSVGGSDFWNFINSHPNGQYAFVHNHLTDSCFSEMDMATLLENNPLDMFIAIRLDGIRYVMEKCKTPPYGYPFFDKLYQAEMDFLNKKVKDGIISMAERTNMREELLVNNLIRDYTKGLIELE